MPSLPRTGPLSYQGAPTLAALKLDDLPSYHLRVITAPGPARNSSPDFASVHPQTCPGWAHIMQPTCLAALAAGSDCVLSVRADAGTPLGCIALTEVQQHNLHALHGEEFEFSVFQRLEMEPFELVEADAEVRPLHRESSNLQAIDADTLAKILSKQLLGRVIAVNEVLVSRVEEAEVLTRFTAVDTLDAQAREEAIGFHSFRGQVTPDTTFWLTGAPQGPRISTSQTSTSRRTADKLPAFALLNARARPAGVSGKHVVNVDTSDGELFPVKRKLLRACITFTSALRDQSHEAPTISVDIDTLTFDRVLIFLEAIANGHPPPNFASRLLDDLSAAAQKLGLRSLEEHCKNKLGAMESRVRVYTLDEVKAHNGRGECWLILDGMILDVTRWLPEHPGGSKIIPAQALNLDCARMFEVFHASRESFLYLKEFYIGELEPQERSLVPCPVLPSEDFLQQLREFTSFRMPVSQKIFKSF